ncbi:vitamin K epoxide reductase family protein [Spirulina subsalsa FACHB-351]|uniref:Vitamin K epoxide reductase family protein n=1 Tax=Spirulina subsalsa FACHB-351 TaxID=234711 RepID=A0ABT3L686_9CYAN|nr:vitamin K epoxide reductase family protein [Spirulina subsalsa]MCW6037021.1 vitamin K epoxide reductase family protein [Spirulina subsalsa FACHB-351]
MKRRRKTPWLHQWSRVIIGAIATVGAILTSYLTIIKLSGSDVVCTGEAAGSLNCDVVLSSPYATVFGVPLPVFGLLAYVSMMGFSLSPYLINEEKNKDLKQKVEDWTGILLLIGATSMAAFSGYLMYILAFKLQAFCPYCIGSAAFAFSMLALTLFGRHWEDVGLLMFIGFLAALVTLLGALGVYANVDGTVGDRVAIPAIQQEAEPGIGWPVTTTSGPAEMALAAHMNEIGVRGYGAWWCPNCHHQKLLFGKEAFETLDYLECDPAGQNPQTAVCQAANVQGYPSWEINGRLYAGSQTLERLSELTGYDGPQNFKYYLPGR